MNKLPYIVFLAVFFIPFAARGLRILPGVTVLLLEVVSGLIFLMALIYCAYHKSLSVSPKYLVLFLAVCLHFMLGAVVNAMDPAVIFAGIRSYLKYMPFFLLPLVYLFSDKEMTAQFKFLVALGLLQLPLVLIQFFVLDWHQDHVGGTFGIGSFMSIFMVCTILVLAAFYFRERISKNTFLILAFLLFIPTTLNESKGTFVLLVVGFLVVMLGANLKRSQMVMATSVLATMLFSFTIVYNAFFDTVGEEGLTSFVTNDSAKGMASYLYTGDGSDVDPNTVLAPDSSVVGALPSFNAEEFGARRIDVIILPLRVLSDDPVKLMFGVGIGNASVSKINLFAGQYSFLDEYNVFGNALSRLLWEIGVLGVLFYLLFFGFIYGDARRLARADGLSGALALGWTGVAVIVVVSLPYKNIFNSEILSSLLWYLSGYIAAKCYALKTTGSASLHKGSVIMPQPSTTAPVSQRSIQNKIR